MNAGNGLTALWVLLTAVGFVIFLLLPVRWAFRWIARRSGSLENGQPTAMMMTITLGIIFVSAFFTDIIGIHAIFGMLSMLPALLNQAHVFRRRVPCWTYHSQR